MKSLARCYLWWSLLDYEIEQKVKSCSNCQIHRPAPTKTLLHLWEWPNRPWSRLHIHVHVDHAGPFLGRLFLVVFDAHSKWIEVVTVSSSEEFCAFVAANEIRHIFT